MKNVIYPPWIWKKLNKNLISEMKTVWNLFYLGIDNLDTYTMTANQFHRSVESISV